MPGESKASELFRGSRKALMAHSIRAVKNYFTQRQVDLDIYIKPDRDGRHMPDRSAPSSLLQTRGSVVERLGRGTIRVQAWIWLHREASWHLARFGIAHEISHLIQELDRFSAGAREEWRGIDLQAEPDIEQKCNEFAVELCEYHNGFNHGASKSELLIFPTLMLSRIRDEAHAPRPVHWPTEWGFNAECPFWDARYFPN